MKATARITNALTIDVEDYFQVSAFANTIAAIDEGVHHVAADISGTTGNKNSHAITLTTK